MADYGIYLIDACRFSSPSFNRCPHQANELILYQMLEEGDTVSGTDRNLSWFSGQLPQMLKNTGHVFAASATPSVYQ